VREESERSKQEKGGERVEESGVGEAKGKV
jgi:hypothetical protein